MMKSRCLGMIVSETLNNSELSEEEEEADYSICLLNLTS